MNKSLSVPARHPVWVVIITSILVILLSLISHSGPIHAQQGGQVQLLTGRAEPGAGSFYLLPNLKRGQTLYVYAQGTSGSLDPLLLLSDKTLDRFKVGEEFRAEVERAIAAGRDPLEVVPEFADRFFTAWDDDSGLGYAAALEYPIPADGDYKLAVVSTPAKDTSGQFRLLVGLDAPDVLSGNAEVTGDTIAVLDEKNTQANVTVQEITGTLTAEDPATFFELNPVKAGDTLYVFAEATSGDLAPIVILTDFGDKPLATGNFSG